MLKLRLIAMGKLTEPFFRDAAASYLKRMSRFWSVTVAEPKVETLPSEPSDGEIARALEKEAARIREEIPPRAALVALCVEGKPMSSEALAAFLDEKASAGVSEVCFVIGSSYGLDPSVKKQADVRLSVSPMTFPHELFRVMLLEQLYRAGEILAGGKYHK